MRTRLFFTLLSTTILLGLASTAIAQTSPSGDLFVLSRQATPDHLQVGQETEIQATLSLSQSVECDTGQSRPSDVVLVIDVSASMSMEGKLQAAQAAASQFVADLDLRTDRIAVVAFSDSAFIVQQFSHDVASIQHVIAGLSTIDQTNLGAALEKTAEVFSDKRLDATGVVVLLSDGKSDAESAARAANGIKSKGTRLFTLSLGNDADRNLMQDLASSPTDSYHAPGSNDLARIYSSIRQRITQTIPPTEIRLSIVVDSARFAIVLGSLVPTGVISGNVAVWTPPAVVESVPQVFHIRVRALQAGSFLASSSARIEYMTCATQPHAIDLGSAAEIVVTAPPAPCETHPWWSNECISSTACFGPFALPCAALGLPWWVCLILALLIPLIGLLWLLWRRLERQREFVRSNRPDRAEMQPPSLETVLWPPLPTYQPQALLTPTPMLTGAQLPMATLVIGLGGTGQGVTHSLQTTVREAFGAPPANLRWLAIELAEASVSDAQSVQLSLSEVRDWIERNTTSNNSDLPTRAWFPPGASSDLNQRTTGRALRRLALFVNLRQVRERLASEMRELAQVAGDGITVYVVGSLAGLTGSGLLIDVAHLTRLQAQAAGISRLALHAIVFTPEAHTARMNVTAQSELHQTGAAAWRELNRFQLAFDRAYPFEYLAERTIRQGKLFERVYLINPARQDGPPLTSVPLEAGLYPAVADAIISLSDPLTRRAWEEVASATDMQLNEKQQRRREPLFRSLGSFTYVLPSEDVLERLALRFVTDLIDAIRRTSLSDVRDLVHAFLGQPSSPAGVASTPLVQLAQQIGTLQLDNAITHAAELGLSLLERFGPQQEDKTQRTVREYIRELATVAMRRHILTSDVVCASDYAADVPRIVREVDNLVGERDQIDAWLVGCRQVQDSVFTRLLNEHLIGMLRFDPARADSTGPAASLNFLKALETILIRNTEAVRAACATKEQQLGQAHSRAQESQHALVEASQHLHERHPTFRRAVLIGILPATGLTVALGTLAGVAPSLSAIAGGVAAAGFGIGAWLSRRMLMGKSRLVSRQHEYLDEQQLWLAADVELALYRAWAQIVENWLKVVQRLIQQLQAWDEHLTGLATTGVPDLSSRLDVLRTARNAIRVRHYLDDEELEKSLYRRFFESAILAEARARFTWQLNADNQLNVLISSEAVDTVSLSDAPAVHAAILNMARAYASRVRDLRVADVMAGMYKPQAVAEEAGPNSAPLIRTWPNLQPDCEDTRLITVQVETQPAFFDEVVRILRKPVAQIHTEKLADATHPYRCSVLAALDVLRLTGLLSWQSALEAYTNLPGWRRAASHIFPAEVNAARWESLVPNINLQPIVFSPTTCLILENERKALDFWRAVACGWVREHDESSQTSGRRRALALTLPEQEPLLLTRLGEESPSLWNAAATFVLTEAGATDTSNLIEAKWQSFIRSADANARRMAIATLEKAIGRATEMRDSADAGLAELGILLHLVAEDGLRRLYQEAPLFDWIA